MNTVCVCRDLIIYVYKYCGWTNFELMLTEKRFDDHFQFGEFFLNDPLLNYNNFNFNVLVMEENILSLTATLSLQLLR